MGQGSGARMGACEAIAIRHDAFGAEKVQESFRAAFLVFEAGVSRAFPIGIFYSSEETS